MAYSKAEIWGSPSSKYNHITEAKSNPNHLKESNHKKKKKTKNRWIEMQISVTVLTYSNDGHRGPGRVHPQMSGKYIHAHLMYLPQRLCHTCITRINIFNSDIQSRWHQILYSLFPIFRSEHQVKKQTKAGARILINDLMVCLIHLSKA